MIMTNYYYSHILKFLIIVVDWKDNIITKVEVILVFHINNAVKYWKYVSNSKIIIIRDSLMQKQKFCLFNISKVSCS